KPVGFCYEGSKRLLVCEYMSNRSLDVHLFGNNSVLNWTARYQIGLGVARMLAYLHDNCGDRVIHCESSQKTYFLMLHSIQKLHTLGWQSI
uniref:Serine-threonine/tyrosine-protein kinase catalytic domain-containing protein n=1 Tax=Aegilops tauschii subsp. strangulata TaxID=200361 RepID=A0A453SRH3_AEGTS